MLPTTPANLTAELADSGGDLRVSLQRMLAAFLHEFGGPEGLGQELAKMTQDQEVAVASRVALANNITRMMAQFSTDAVADDLLSEEQIVRQLRALEKERAADGD